jgi:hypothetical protein
MQESEAVQDRALTTVLVTSPLSRDVEDSPSQAMEYA